MALPAAYLVVERRRLKRPPGKIALLAGAVVVLGLGWLRPTPWLLALLVSVVLTVVWVYAINRWLAAGGGTDGQLPT